MWDTETRRRKGRGGFGRLRTHRWGSTARSGPARRLLVPLIVGCCAVASLWVALDFGANTGVIHRGVSVGGVPLGGKTPEEARGILEDPEQGVLGEIALVRGSERFSFDGAEVGVDPDYAGTAERAYDVGREGTLPQRLVERLVATFGAYSVSPKVDYRPEAARAQGFAIMVGCMVGTSLAMAPATLLAPWADFVDLDGPLLLARDREPGLRFEGSTVHPPTRELWG